MPVDSVRQQVGGDVLIMECGRQAVSLIDDPATSHVSAAEVLISNVLQVAKCIRVVQRAVLAKTFPVVTALDLMQQRIAADVGAGEQIAMAIEVESPGVAAALGEQFELFG